jgi:hypothetical protein
MNATVHNLYNDDSLANASDRLKATPQLQSGGGGGTLDGMNERITRLEARTELFAKQFDRIAVQLDGIGNKLDVQNLQLAKLPTREFLLTTVLAAFAVALAVAALTFQVADYAAKQSAAPAVPSAPSQPVVIVVPSQSAQTPPGATQQSAEPARSPSAPAQPNQN